MDPYGKHVAERVLDVHCFSYHCRWLARTAHPSLADDLSGCYGKRCVITGIRSSGRLFPSMRENILWLVGHCGGLPDVRHSGGLPYYNMPFFYDYFQREFHWTKGQITFGFPLAALLTLWIGPVLVPRFSPRKLILVGTALTCAAFVGFGTMHGALWLYYAFWFLYTVGYILSGPIPHQLVISHWFRRNRGKAMGILYVGVGLIGFLGSYAVKPLTEDTNFHTALIVWGALMFLAWPLALLRHTRPPRRQGPEHGWRQSAAGRKR